MPAAAPPSPEQFLPDLKGIYINKNGFNMAREQRGYSVPEFGVHPARPEQRAAARFSAVHRRLLLGQI